MNKIFAKYQSLSQQVRASIWFLLCVFLQRGVSSITTPIFTRLLSVTEYGQFSVFNSWLSIITILVSFSLYSGVYTQGLVKFDSIRKEYTSALQGLTLTLVLTWTVVYLTFRNFWNDLFSLTTVQMLAMLLIIWTSAVFGFWSVEQRVDYKYRKLIIVTLLISFLKPSVGIFFVLNADDKVTARILAIALVEVVAYTGFFFAQMHRGKKFYSKKIWKYALLFNAPLIPHYLSLSILNSADRIMIRNMVGESAAGIYSLAYSISMIMCMFNTALMQTLEPWLYKKIKTGQIKDIGRIAYPSFIMIAGLNLTLIAMAPEIIRVFAPKAYYDAIWVIPPVAMGVFFMFLYTFFAVFEFYFEKTKYITMATIIGATANIILNYIFINLFGYIAAGYTTLVCYILFAVFHYTFMRRTCREYFKDVHVYDIRIILSIVSIFMVLGFTFMLTYKNWMLRYAIVIVLLVMIFMKRKMIFKSIKNIFNIQQNA